MQRRSLIKALFAAVASLTPLLRAALRDPARRMLGAAQEQWLRDRLSATFTCWPMTWLEDLSRLAKNPAILSGDMHTAMAAELSLPDVPQPVAVEFMAPSVTSPGIPAALPEKSPGALRDATLCLNPHLKYMDMQHRGWLCLTLTPGRCRGEWHLPDGVRERDYESEAAQSLWVEAGKIGDGLRNSPAGACIAGDRRRTVRSAGSHRG